MHGIHANARIAYMPSRFASKNACRLAAVRGRCRTHPLPRAYVPVTSRTRCRAHPMPGAYATTRTRCRTYPMPREPVAAHNENRPMQQNSPLQQHRPAQQEPPSAANNSHAANPPRTTKPFRAAKPPRTAQPASAAKPPRAAKTAPRSTTIGRSKKKSLGFAPTSFTGTAQARPPTVHGRVTAQKCVQPYQKHVF